MHKKGDSGKIRLLVIEDSYDDMELAAGLLKKHFPDVKLFRAGSKEKASEVLRNHNIDLLLLEVCLPDGSGFDLVQEIRDYPQYRFLHVVFITGQKLDPLDIYNKYHCYSFIAKPYTEEFFIEQLTPLIELLRKKIGEGRQSAGERVRLFKVSGGERLVPLEDILYIDIVMRKVTLHTRKEDIVIRGFTLNKVREYINDPDFFQCHKGFIVNLQHMTGINNRKDKGPFAELDNGDIRCMISQRHLPELRILLKNKNGA